MLNYIAKPRKYNPGFLDRISVKSAGVRGCSDWTLASIDPVCYVGARRFADSQILRSQGSNGTFLTVTASIFGKK